MRNWVLALTTAIAIAPGVGHAFSPGQFVEIPFGEHCQVYKGTNSYNGNATVAFVWVQDLRGNFDLNFDFVAGEYYWLGGERTTNSRPALTVEVIEGCLGVDGAVTSFSATGADIDSTVAEQEYMGFNFTLGAGTIYEQGVYEFYIGSDGPRTSGIINQSPALAPPPTPASEFAENETEIRQVLTETAQRSLSATLGANRRMNEEALDRFIDARRDLRGDGAGFVSRTNVPFDVDGSFELSGSTLSTRGNFFEQTGNYEGTYRRLLFGDFDIQHDADTDSTTATLTARVAWEHLVTDQTMLGYFVGGELARSTINGTFDGDQGRFGLTVGGYAVHQLAEQVYLDGFLTFGAGRNDLEMANDVLELESDYTTRTATIGAALSGVYEYGSYEFRPELAFSYGYTWIGNVGFTGRAYGLVDDTLSLDAGDVSIANLTLRPEVIWALDGLNVAESNSRFSFAPRLICERVEAGTMRQDCGGGAEFSLSSMSSDGLTEFNVRMLADRVGSSTRTGLELGIQHQF